MFTANRIRNGRIPLLLPFATLAAAAALVGQNALPVRHALTAIPNPQTVPPAIVPEVPAISEKKKRDLLKYNFEQMKKDAQELSSLAKTLQDDLEHSNQNVLSLDVIAKAEKIEKLAKKIKTSAKDLPPGPLTLPYGNEREPLEEQRGEH